MAKYKKLSSISGSIKIAVFLPTTPCSSTVDDWFHEKTYVFDF